MNKTICDPERIRRIMAEVKREDDRLWLSQELEPPWLQRQRRLNARDGAVRELARLIPDPRSTVVAKRIARDLAGYLGSRWRSERDLAELPPAVSERHRLLHRIAKLNTGDPLAWRTILRALPKKPDAMATRPAEGAAYAIRTIKTRPAA